MERKSPQSILETYRPGYGKPGSNTIGVLAIGGLAGLVYGALDNNVASAITGATCWATIMVSEAVDYARAYMEAKLDFQANGRYTRLDVKK